MLLAVALAGCGALVACGHGQARPVAAQPPVRKVLDYRNGWYHTATGQETIAIVAYSYDRDAEFVAQLNHASVNARPAKGTHLYIPPTNDVNYVRRVLTRLNGDTSQVPKIPWNHKRATPALKGVVERKVASKRLKEKLSTQSIYEEERMVADAAPTTRYSGGTEKPRPKPAASAVREKKPGSGRAKPVAAPVFKKDESFHWPLDGEIVTRYKERRCRGIEIAAEEKSPVKAARSGIVLLAQDCPAYGNLVLIDHGDGYASVYGYNSTITVKENDWVKGGQQIASVGRPSRGAPGKLFFQIRRNAKPVDPMDYLN